MTRTGKLARNERRKLEANSINAVGLSGLGVGFLMPFFGGDPLSEVLVRFCLSAMFALLFHAWAQQVLRGLEG